MIQRQDIAGVILAGGHSRRFGSDKAFASLQGKTLVDRVLDLLRPNCGELIIAANMSKIFEGIERAEIVRDAVPNKGPLGGIVAAMHGTAKKWFLILGCDVMASASAIDALLCAETKDARIAIVDGRPQYLCGVYSRKLLAHFEECIGRGILSMKAALASVAGVDFTAVPPGSISNINTREDLVAYEERAASYAS